MDGCLDMSMGVDCMAQSSGVTRACDAGGEEQDRGRLLFAGCCMWRLLC